MCFASISLKTYIPEDSDKPEVIQPFQVANLNLNHVEGYHPKPNDFFEERSFLKKVKEIVFWTIIYDARLFSTIKV